MFYGNEIWQFNSEFILKIKTAVFPCHSPLIVFILNLHYTRFTWTEKASWNIYWVLRSVATKRLSRLVCHQHLLRRKSRGRGTVMSVKLQRSSGYLNFKIRNSFGFGYVSFHKWSWPCIWDVSFSSYVFRNIKQLGLLL